MDKPIKSYLSLMSFWRILTITKLLVQVFFGLKNRIEKNFSEPDFSRNFDIEISN